MGLFRKVTRLAAQNSGKIRKAAEDNADKITDTVGKVADKVDERTGGKYTDKLEKAEDAVGKALKKDDGPDTPRTPTDPPRS